MAKWCLRQLSFLKRTQAFITILSMLYSWSDAFLQSITFLFVVRDRLSMTNISKWVIRLKMSSLSLCTNLLRILKPPSAQLALCSHVFHFYTGAVVAVPLNIATPWENPKSPRIVSADLVTNKTRALLHCTKDPCFLTFNKLLKDLQFR